MVGITTSLLQAIVTMVGMPDPTSQEAALEPVMSSPVNHLPAFPSHVDLLKYEFGESWEQEIDAINSHRMSGRSVYITFYPDTGEVDTTLISPTITVHPQRMVITVLPPLVD